MDQRLLKQWEVTRSLLASAAFEVQHAQGYQNYQGHLAQNDLELALNCLQEIGMEGSVSADFWWNLKKAAEVMGLEHRRAELRRQRLKVVKSHGSEP